MAIEILPVGSGAEDSEDVEVLWNFQLHVCLKGADGTKLNDRAGVRILLKSGEDSYVRIGNLSARYPTRLINAPGTYRFSRIANGVACGVFDAYPGGA